MPTTDDTYLAAALLGSVAHGRAATSMRALPFLATARHIVVDGRLLLRMHRGYGYHRACVGHVIAYGADNVGEVQPGPAGQWSAQVVGSCEAVEPTPAELALFGPEPRLVDGEPYEAVYLQVIPQFATVHSTDGALQRHFEHLGHLL